MRGTRIPGLKQYQGRNPNGYFRDLDPKVRQQACAWLHRFCERARRRRGSVPRWLFAIYVGQAKRLALNPPTYEWSRWMNAKKGGYTAQRLYRRQGRNPTELATLVHQNNARMRWDTKQRERLGLPPRARHWFTVGNEP